MPTCANNIVEPQILNFQARYAAMLQNRRLTPVRPAQRPNQERMLGDIWALGRLGESSAPGMERLSADTNVTVKRSWAGWRRIGLWVNDESGFGEETDPLLEVELFRDVGELGLECLVSYNTP